MTISMEMQTFQFVQLRGVSSVKTQRGHSKIRFSYLILILKMTKIYNGDGHSIKLPELSRDSVTMQCNLLNVKRYEHLSIG